MLTVGYVVLHYQAVKDTIECVESICKFNEAEKPPVVVVDNASPNGTGKLLLEKYQDRDDIKVILNETNEGFARGLNIGIDYLRNTLGVDFCVLLNNDTLIAGNDWHQQINQLYDTYHFAALGPDIVSPDGTRHDNPAPKQDVSVSGVTKAIREKKTEQFLWKIHVMPLVYFAKTSVKKILGYKSRQSDAYLAEQTNVQLQGSCLILSPLYFSKYEGLFPGTYLYFEEAILRNRCEKNGWPCLYSPKLQLIHKGSVSVSATNKKVRAKMLFYFQHSLNSCMVFLQSDEIG